MNGQDIGCRTGGMGVTTLMVADKKLRQPHPRDDLDVLYVTSASDKLTPEQRRREPLAGALFRLRPGERGVARRCTLY